MTTTPEQLGKALVTLHKALTKVQRLKAQAPGTGLRPDLLGKREESPGTSSDQWPIGVAYLHIHEALEQLCDVGLTVKQASFLLHEVIGLVVASGVFDNRDER